jgi:hypothetical protein
MAAQKKIRSAIAILTLRLNPRSARKSQREITQSFCSGSRVGCSSFVHAGDTPASTVHLHRDWCFDRWVWVVPDEFEVFELEIVNIFHGRIQLHPGQGSTIP